MKTKYIQLDHGSGGLASQQLIESLFLKHLEDPRLHQLEDAAVLQAIDGKLAFSTDSYVVDPLFFPGGNIGDLAVNGTINDLAMQGADPLCLSLGLILEESMDMEQLEKIMETIGAACRYAGVPVVTGDTKVVPKGKGDRLFINTSGIGVVRRDAHISVKNIRPGDTIILSGPIADHGITVLTSREGLEVGGDIRSDTRPLHFLVQEIVSAAGGAIHAMRDPTRGGVGTTLSEFAQATGLCMEIDEAAIPIKPEVRAACELMGLDPLYLANEGRCVVVCTARQAEKIVQNMRGVKEGRNSAIIGRVTENHAGRVVLTTISGGKRLVEPLTGEPLPRIC